MAILKIYESTSPVLRHKAKPVRKVDDAIRKLAADMLETMREAPGVGLAGPQIGRAARIIVVEYDDDEFSLINPTITWSSKETAMAEEGCLSIPTLYGDVERALEVRLTATDMRNKRVVIEADDWLARIFQHEIDHLDGILFTDRMAPGAPLRTVSANADSDEEI